MLHVIAKCPKRGRMILSIDDPVLIEVGMSWQLSLEVTRYLTRNIGKHDGAEMAVLYALAEKAGHDGSYPRQAWDTPIWKLSWFCGSKSDDQETRERALRAVCKRLARHGLVIRVEHGTDGLGNPMYARRGKAVTWQVPDLDATSTMPVDNSNLGGTVVPPNHAEPVDNSELGGTVDPPSGTVVPPSPSLTLPSNPPRSLTTVTSLAKKREESQKRGDIISNKSKADNHDVVQTILNMPGIHNQMSRFGEARLRVVVEACQKRGISDQQMISAVGDRSFDGVRYLERALSARLEALEVRTPDVDTKVERCRLHGHSDALHCPSCWGVVKAGSDPYEGCEDQRPEGWHMVYAWSPSVKTVTIDETEVEPLNLTAAFTAMLA